MRRFVIFYGIVGLLRMKTAEQMFEKLGYKLVRNNMYEKLNLMCYKIDLYDNDSSSIVFNLNDKTFFVYHYCEPKDVTMDELKAINQQCKELGWI